MGDRFGPNNPNWKGGRVVEPRGYVLIRVGVGHPLADVRGYAYEHRLKAAEALGRDLLPDEEVHHKGSKGDNSPDMIEPLPMLKHREIHRKRTDLRPVGAPNPIIVCACGCGSTLEKYDDDNRPRRFLPDHSGKAQPSPTIDAILALLREGDRSTHEIIKATGKSKTSVATCLTRMKSARLVDSVRHGVWKKVI